MIEIARQIADELGIPLGAAMQWLQQREPALRQAANAGAMMTPAPGVEALEGMAAATGGSFGDMEYLTRMAQDVKRGTPLPLAMDQDTVLPTTDEVGRMLGGNPDDPLFQAGSFFGFDLAGPAGKALGFLSAAAPAAVRMSTKAAGKTIRGGIPVEDALIVQHNMTPENVLHAERMGGMPMPSIGITKASQPIDAYGDITLLGDQAMARPTGTNPVFSYDAYTPRYPDVTTFLTDDDVIKLNKYFAEPFGSKTLWNVNRKDGKRVPVFTDFSNVQDRGIDAIKDETAAKARYLWEQKKLPDPDKFDNPYDWSKEVDKLTDYGRSADYQKWADQIPEKVGGLNPDEKIFIGFTNAGNKRYKPHTLDNVISIMKKEFGDNNQSNWYGAGAFRAHSGPRFRNITEVKEARDRIVSPESFREIKDEMNDRLYSLVDEFSKHSKYKDSNPFIHHSYVQEQLGEIAKRQSSFDDYFDAVPDDLKDQFFAYMKELRDSPTTYFEAKPKRAVELGEFSNALVPEGTDKEIIDILSRHGLEIGKYTDAEDRARKIMSMENLLFQHPAATLLGGSLAAALLANMGGEESPYQ